MTFVRKEVPRSWLVRPGNGVVALASRLGWYSSGSGRKAERKKQRGRQRGRGRTDEERTRRPAGEGAKRRRCRKRGEGGRREEASQDVHLSSMGLQEPASAAITQSLSSLVRSSATAAMLVPVGASTTVQDLHGEGLNRVP